jgi:phosphoserine phosphatase RsbU/P
VTHIGPPRTNPDLKPADILALGDQIATMTDYPTQKGFLENFLQERYVGKAAIWLKSPHKSITVNLPKTTFPFDPDIGSPDKSDSDLNTQTFTINHVHWAICPLKQGGTAFGSVILQREYPFIKSELDELLSISRVAGLAIYATLQTHLHHWRQKQLNLVRSVTARISQITDLEILTTEISRLIQETFEYYYVAVFLIHENTRRLHFKASVGSDESDRPEFEQDSHPGFVLGEHMIGHVAKTGRELVANNVADEPRYQVVDSLAATKAEVVIPLKVESRIFGVLDIQANTQYAFDDDDLMVLRALADNIAIAIESTRLYQGVQRRAEQLATVSDVSRAITYILDIDELLQKIVNLIHNRFQFPFVHLYTTDPVHQQILFKAGSGERTRLYEEAGVSYDINSTCGILPWVVQNRRTKRVSDVENEPLFREAPITQAIKGSEMAVPLSFGGEILGVLDLQSDQKNAFSEEDQQLMETLADNLAIAIRNARLYRSEKWRRQVAESLRDVAGLLSDNIALEDVLNTILEQLHKNLPCDIAVVWLFDNNQSDDNGLYARKLTLAAYKTITGYPTEALASLTYAPDEWINTVLSQREPKIRQPDETIGPIAEHYELDPDYSAIAAPLSTGDEVLGLLTMIHHTPGRYGDESQKITSAFASYAAIAIKNTRLYATSQEQAWISTILLQVSNAIQSLTNLDELIATIVRLTPMVVGVKGCALFLRVPESKVFQLSAIYGISDSSEDVKLEQPLPLISPPILEELLLVKEPLHVRNPQEDLNLPEGLSLQLAKNTLILFPLMARNEVLGAFLLANDSKQTQEEQLSDVLSGEGYKIVQGIMQQTAVAIENIRLIESRQEEAYISAVLLQAAQAAVSSADLQDTLDSMVNIMPILVGIDASVIYLWDENEDRFKTSHATIRTLDKADNLIGTLYQPGDFPMLDAVFKNNRPIVYPFVETALPPEDWDLALPDEGQIDPTPVLQTHYPLLMGFPLSVKDEIFGVLLAEDENYATNRERRFELLWGIAQQASLAIQNDLLNKEMLDRQRIEREFQLAREIQQTFLPDQILSIPGWEMDVRWETARQVGGDFYDYFMLSDGRLAFVIADVSDKGLAASLYMAVTRTLLRAAAEGFDSPGKTLEHVNTQLLNNSQDGLFVTTFYGILTLDDGLLSYTIAGHNPPMVIRHRQNDIITLEKGGIAIGALQNISLSDHQLTLNPGDCLVLYTDGVTEAFNLKDQMYGDDRFIRLLGNLIGESASSVLEAIEADLAKFRDGAPLSDDTTMLAIYRVRSLGNDHGDLRAA